MATKAGMKQLAVLVSEEVWTALHERWRQQGAKRGGKQELVEEALRIMLGLPLPDKEDVTDGD